MVYQAGNPFVGLLLLIVGWSNMGSPVALALFVASFWIFTGGWIK
jgi:protein-S-isoprenylcysteine O-methyltransferase Ste14